MKSLPMFAVRPEREWSRWHASNGSRTACGRRVRGAWDGDGELTWADAVHDELDTCKACVRAAPVASR